jgi:hypothetical protein
MPQLYFLFAYFIFSGLSTLVKTFPSNSRLGRQAAIETRKKISVAIPLPGFLFRTQLGNGEKLVEVFYRRIKRRKTPQDLQWDCEGHHGLKFMASHRPTKQESLVFVAAPISGEDQLLFGFDPLHHDC